MGIVKDKSKICRNWNLYVITDLSMALPRTYSQIIHEVLLGGANVIQLRDKTTPFEKLIDISRKFRPLFDEFGATFIVNDNPYLAKEVNADGVHLGQEDTPVDIAREIVGDECIIGLSTHSRTQVLKAMLQDVDYIGLGPIYPTTTKSHPYKPLGLEMVAWGAREVRIPFIPIGGITSQNICDVIRVGKTTPAVVSAVMKAPNLMEATRNLISIIRETRREMS